MLRTRVFSASPRRMSAAAGASLAGNSGARLRSVFSKTTAFPCRLAWRWYSMPATVWSRSALTESGETMKPGGRMIVSVVRLNEG